MAVIPLPKTYTEKEAAEALGFSVDTLQRMRAAGKIRYRRLGNGRGRIRYTQFDLEHYLESCEEGAWQTNDLGNAGLIGSASDPIAQSGAEHGSRLDKPAALRLAQQTFRQPSTDSLRGMWRTAPCETNNPQASGSRK